ncbi:MAG: hypothetical protein K0R28_2360 [Paenibacillus sp.]|jgi:hypothetical protein|nr:hypothetical protein [Paenibacillus sp.]
MYYLLDKTPFFTNKSDVLAICFGVTSGIMALIGLVAIFVSINSQHSAEKCREILWDLMSIDSKLHREISDDEQKEIKKMLWLYGRIIKHGFFTKAIVVLSFFTLLVVSTIWIVLIHGLKESLDMNNNAPLQFAFITFSNEYSFVSFWTKTGAFIVAAFAIMLLFLVSIARTGSLPSLNDILNANKKTNVHTLTLAALSSSLSYKVTSKNDILLHIRFLAPFYNLQIEVTAITKDEDDIYDSEEVKEEHSIHIPNKRFWSLSSSSNVNPNNVSRNWFSIPVKKIGKYPSVEAINLSLKSKIGHVTCSFDVIEPDDRRIPVSVRPVLVVENSYFETENLFDTGGTLFRLKRILYVIQSEAMVLRHKAMYWYRNKFK